IFVNAAVNWSSNNSLTLNAYRNIEINANITNTGGAGVILRADSTGTGIGTVSFASGKTLSTDGAVSIFYNPVSYTDLTHKSDTSGNPYSGFVTGDGTLTAYMLVNNVNNLQNVQTNLRGTYALGRNIDASATATWNDNAGFLPIGRNSDRGFVGRFDGQN